MSETEPDLIVARTRSWLEKAVLGLNLCPFARSPFNEGRIRYSVSDARSEDVLLEHLSRELQSLQATDSATCETTLLIHPCVLGDFLAYNDFLNLADDALQTLGLTGIIQIASFHPDYQFAGSAPDDIENFTNRSPYPTLHLLRESSVERAVAALEEPASIYQRNMATLRRLGHEGWQRLWQDADNDTP